MDKIPLPDDDGKLKIDPKLKIDVIKWWKEVIKKLS